MDPTLNPNYTYSGNSLTPQQRQQMQMQANGLIPYNTPVNTPGAGVGQMANALVNGLLQNKSMQQYLNGGQQAAPQQIGAPMQLPSSSLSGGNPAMDTATMPNATSPVTAPPMQLSSADPNSTFSGLFGT